MTILASRLRGGFLGDVLKLSIGTLGGRLIALAALPVVTRLYSPQDFALLAVYLALVSTLTVVACLRLEVAIPLAETEGEAVHLFVLAFIVLMIVTSLLAVATMLIPDWIVSALDAPGLSAYLWLVPLGICMGGSYSALQFWATRARRFGVIARTRIGQAATGVCAVLVLGWVGLAPFGLLFGNMLNMSAGGINLGANALTRDAALLRTVRLRDLATTFHRNLRYPLWSTPDALFNVAGVQLPVLLIAANAGIEAGYLFLTMQVMAVPMALLGSSISQVYVSRAPAEYREGRLASYTLTIMRRLAYIGALPLIAAGALAPIAFPLLFGAQWTRAGELVTWIVPWMALQFVTSPVSIVMYIVGWQRQSFLLNLANVVGRVSSVLLALRIGTSPTEAFIVSSAVFNFVFLVACVAASRRHCAVPLYNAT